MKIRIKHPYRQVCLFLLLGLILAACRGRELAPVIPPPTSPLVQAQIGFGVINVSFTRIHSEPDENSVSLGYLRQGTVVKIIERRLIQNRGRIESWLLVEEVFTGWLREPLIDVYDNERQARTAANAMR